MNWSRIGPWQPAQIDVVFAVVSGDPTTTSESVESGARLPQLAFSAGKTNAIQQK